MNLRPALSDRTIRPVMLGFDLMTTGPGPMIIGLGVRLTRSITLLGGIGEFIRGLKPDSRGQGASNGANGPRIAIRLARTGILARLRRGGVPGPTGKQSRSKCTAPKSRVGERKSRLGHIKSRVVECKSNAEEPKPNRPAPTRGAGDVGRETRMPAVGMDTGAVPCTNPLCSATALSRFR